MSQLDNTVTASIIGVNTQPPAQGKAHFLLLTLAHRGIRHQRRSVKGALIRWVTVTTPAYTGYRLIRHDPGGETPLSHQEQIDRLKIGLEMGVKLERVITHANDEWVTLVWNMHSETGAEGMTLCGIEVFKVEGGLLAHAWNTPYADGQWSPYEG